MKKRELLGAASAVSAGLMLPTAARAQKKYDKGATDKEIKIGQCMPYSGNASAYGTIGKVQDAYFKMINEKGGINGRMVKFLSVDDGYSPPKTVEMIRKLVEQDEVLAIVNTLGTPPNTAIHKYMNGRKVPQLFVATGATKWNDPKNHPWTMGWQPNYQSEGRIYAAYMIKNRPNGKIALLYQNDDYGKDYLKGFKDGLGDRTKQIVSELSYEVTDPTVDSQIVAMKASGADVFFNITTPKFAAMAIRKAADIGWKPMHFLNQVSASVGVVLVPAGLDKSVDILSTQYLKDPTDKAWDNDKGLVEWKAFMHRYYPAGDLKDVFNVFGYSVGQTVVEVLRRCGDNLTRENLMKQAASLKNFELPCLLPGIKINTGPDDFAPIESQQMVKFDGKEWVRFGEIIG